MVHHPPPIKCGVRALGPARRVPCRASQCVVCMAQSHSIFDVRVVGHPNTTLDLPGTWTEVGAGRPQAATRTSLQPPPTAWRRQTPAGQILDAQIAHSRFGQLVIKGSLEMSALLSWRDALKTPQTSAKMAKIDPKKPRALQALTTPASGWPSYPPTAPVV